MKRIIYWLLSKWHLYRGVEFSFPVKRYHFERYVYYNQLRRGERPNITKAGLYRKGWWI
jgi:hypothetical protein